MPLKQQTNQRKPRYRRVPDASPRIQERDAEIIHHIYKHRFLNSEHIAALVGGSQQGILRRLNLLFHGGYLDRPPEQIRPYRQGSDPMVYGLGNKGADFLGEQFKIPRSKVDWTSKNRTVKRIYLEHSLMVAHFMVCLELACRGRRDVVLIEPTAIAQAAISRGRDPNKPFSWKVKFQRTFNNERRTLSFSMVPDKVFGLHFPEDPPGKNKAFFFVEADRSTMPIKRTNIYKSSYFKKMLGYWESWRQELWLQAFGFSAARILTLTVSEDRIKSMIEAGREMDERGKGSRMFLFAQASGFSVDHPGRVLEKVWQNGRDTEIVSLFD